MHHFHHETETPRQELRRKLLERLNKRSHAQACTKNSTEDENDSTIVIDRTHYTYFSNDDLYERDSVEMTARISQLVHKRSRTEREKHHENMYVCWLNATLQIAENMRCSIDEKMQRKECIEGR